MRIRVLGTAEVTGDDGAPRPLERKAREVLTVLTLMAPSHVSPAELVDLLWDAPPRSAMRTVQSHVSRLRAALAAAALPAPGGPAVVGGYALAAPPGATDVDVMRELRDDARRLRSRGRLDDAVVLLAEARSLWRGEVELPATVAAAALAERWAQERRSLVEEHLAAVVDGSHPADAVAELRAATAADPLDEGRWVLLVRALGRTGRAPEALRAYQSAHAALAEVGLTPGAVLRDAEAAVAAGPGTAAGPPPATAPGPRAGGPGALAPTAGGPSTAGARRAVGLGVDLGPVRYARVGPASVAYRAVRAPAPPPGERASLPLVVLNPGAVSIDALDGEPGVTAAFGALAERGPVVTLDRRGVGLSDPLDGPRPDADAWVADTLAVIDAAAPEPPVLMASSDVALVALALAAEHPDQVRALVLVHGYARYLRAGDTYPYGVDPETARSASQDALAPEPAPGDFDPLSHIAPSVAGDPGFRAWWEAMGRRAASPATAAALHEAVYGTDVRALVPRVAVPTLVLHRRSCASCDIGHARYLADHVPDARLALLPGADELWFTGAVGPLLAELDGFLASLRTTPGGDPTCT